MKKKRLIDFFYCRLIFYPIDLNALKFMQILFFYFIFTFKMSLIFFFHCSCIQNLIYFFWIVKKIRTHINLKIPYEEEKEN